MSRSIDDQFNFEENRAMKKALLVAAVLASGVFSLLPESAYADGLIQWGPGGGGGGWGSGSSGKAASQPAKPGKQYEISFKKTDGLDGDQIVEALTAMPNVLSVSYNKETGKYTIVMKNKTQSSEAAVKKALEKAGIENAVIETFEEIKTEKSGKKDADKPAEKTEESKKETTK